MSQTVLSQLTIYITFIRNSDQMGKLIARFIFWITGWKVDENFPKDQKKYVIAAAPHTSNWDFLYAMCAFKIIGINMRFTIKKEWLKFPFKGLMLSMGAIPIDRRPKKEGEERPSMTQVMTDLFEKYDELALLVTPEGTRSPVSKWKTGFYYVALNAGVPIYLGYGDYKRKVAGVGKIIYPTGDFEKDMGEFMDFYMQIGAKHPEKFLPDERFV